MTRSTLKRSLRRVYALLILVLGISFLAKIADHIPVLAGTGAEKILKDAYEYPFAPLHDMRRALQTLDPRKTPEADADTRNLVRDAILQSFYALRETFLEELEQETPDHPLLISGGRRMKVSGSTKRARRAQERQRARQDREPSPDPRIDGLLGQLYDKENATPKPWRQPVGDGAERSSAPDSRAA